jgi:hypothetical protein
MSEEMLICASHIHTHTIYWYVIILTDETLYSIQYMQYILSCRYKQVIHTYIHTYILYIHTSLPGYGEDDQTLLCAQQVVMKPSFGSI